MRDAECHPGSGKDGNSDPFLGSPVTETGSPHRQVTRAAEGWSVVSFLRIWALTVTSLCLALVLVSSLLRSMRGNQAVLQAPQNVRLLVWAQEDAGIAVLHSVGTINM